jgi:ribitol 2-dehydrogenase
MAQSVRDKLAVVTGASSGVGRATARLLAHEGAHVVLVARPSDRLTALGEELGAAAHMLPADLTVNADIDAMVRQAEQQFGRIDVLFANAGIYLSGPVIEGDPDEWDRLLQINVHSVFRAIRRALPGMLARRSGDIIVTSSISGHQAIHWEPIYSASKHAIQAFVHGVRRQIMAANVRIGAVAPGMILNELWGITDPAEVERLVAERSGLRSEDVAEAVLFMLTRPANVCVRDLVMLPSDQDL